MKDNLQEQILSSWILINSQLKDSRITESLTYNEAIVMKFVYDNYKCDGIGKTSIQKLIKSTNILKSLMNRTITSLCKQNYLKKEKVGRNTYVYPIKNRIPDFLVVHNNSLKIAQQVIDAIGEDDAKNFIRICQKMIGVKFEFNERG